MAALDSTIRKLEQQLKKRKEKIQEGHRQAKRKQIQSPADDEVDQ
jgi:ribosome-associated translation inhibitor RaiA